MSEFDGLTREGLIQRLREDPELALEVVAALRPLSDWKPRMVFRRFVDSSAKIEILVRADADELAYADVGASGIDPDQYPGRGWLAWITIPRLAAHGTHHPDIESALAAADAELEKNGCQLVNPRNR